MKRPLSLVLSLALSLVVGTAGPLPAQNEDAPPATDAREVETPNEQPQEAVEPAAETADHEDFATLKSQWTDLLGKLRATLLAYQQADTAERETLRAEYNALVKQGETLLPRLITAAEAAFKANPEPQGEPALFLQEVVKDQALNRQQYELPARIGMLLLDAGAKDPVLLEATGIALYQRGKYEEAAALLERAAELGEVRPMTGNLLAQARAHLGIVKHRESIAALEEQVAAAEKPDEETVGKLLNLLRLSEQNLDDFEQAARISQLLIDKGVDTASLYDVAGVAFFMTNQFDLAEEYLNKAADAGRISPLGRSSLENIDYYKKLWEEEQAFRKADAAGEALPQVVLKTNKGDITLELFENEAPQTVGNFVSLVEKGYYDGTIFHRVLPGFMAQGGDPEGTGSGGPGYTIPDELDEPYRKHFRGYMSMAKTAAPDSGGSQFFLTFVPTKHLDGKHTVFGRVIDGLDVLALLQRRNPGPEGPLPDRIVEARVISKRDHEYKPTISGVGN